MDNASDCTLPSLIGPTTLADLVQQAEHTPPGAWVEVGVYRGGSAQRLYIAAQQQRRTLWLFDTFTGMPFCHEGDAHPVGDFGNVDLPALKAAMPAARFIEGVFPDTLTAKVLREIAPIAFVHVDCDQYASVKACIEHLIPLMALGGVMWFDDPGCLESADRAVNETLAEQTQTLNGKRYYIKR